MPNDLKHVGILGMRWGHRKNVNSVVNAKPHPTLGNRVGIDGSVASKTVREKLVKQLKAAQSARKSSEFAMHVEAENKFIKSFDEASRKKMSEIDAGPGSKISKTFKKFWTADRANVIYGNGLNKAYNDTKTILKANSRKRFEKELAGEKVIMAKYAKIDAERAAARKKLPLAKRIIQFMKDDKEVSDMYINDLLQNAIDNA